MAVYLTVVEVLAIHDAVIETFGGAAGIRDLGALEAAVFRPQTGYYRDSIEEAAALMESLLQGHPFLDGNKRTAFAAADVHLRLNGHFFSGDPEKAHDFIESHLAAGTVDRAAIDDWLRFHTSPLG